MEEAEKPASHTPTELLEPQKRNLWQRLRHSIIYGGEQTFFCLATDPLEPVVNNWYQNKHGDQKHHVSHTQTFGSEFMGDGAAFFAFVAIKTLFAAPVNLAISGMRVVASPIVNWRADKATKRWASEHQVDENDPRYKERYEKYKTLSAESLVDSGIIAGSAVGLNLLSQRHVLKNEQSYLTMLKGKVLGTIMTFGAMSITALAFPRVKRKVEKAIENTVIDPVMNFVRGSVGGDDEVTPVITKTQAGQMPSSSIPLSAEKREGLLALVAEHAMKIDLNDPKARAALIAKQKTVYQAFIKALAPEGPLVEAMTRQHNEFMEYAHQSLPDSVSAESRIHDNHISQASIQASAAHKRRDMQHFLALLDDPEFLKDLGAAVASGKVPERRNSTITSEQRDHMSKSLLTRSPGNNPASTILDTAENQALDYKALSHALRPDSDSTRILAEQLKKQLPDYDEKDIDGIAKDYMQYYQKEALNMAAEFAPKSATVAQAVHRAEALRGKYHPAPEASYALAT